MRNVHFLTVDDSPIVLSRVRGAIEAKIGAKQIVEASNGKDALEALRHNNIDMIISDWNMPHMNGEELLYEVRNSERWKNIPFIMMSSNSKRDFLITAIQNGVTNYIVKPFTPAELEDKIRRSWNCTARRRAERFFLSCEHRLVIRLESRVIPAKVINISRTGILVSLEYVPDLQLFKQYKLILEIVKPDGQNSWIISPIYGMVVRLEVENCFYPSSSMCLMAFSFIPSMLSNEVEAKLDGFLKWLSSRKPDVIGTDDFTACKSGPS